MRLPTTSSCGEQPDDASTGPAVRILGDADLLLPQNAYRSMGKKVHGPVEVTLAPGRNLVAGAIGVGLGRALGITAEAAVRSATEPDRRATYAHYRVGGDGAGIEFCAPTLETYGWCTNEVYECPVAGDCHVVSD